MYAARQGSMVAKVSAFVNFEVDCLKKKMMIEGLLTL